MIVNTVIKGGGSAPDSYLEFENDSGTLVRKVQQIYLTGITDPGVSFYSLFNKTPLTADTSISFNPITTISQIQACQYMFYGCMLGNNYSLNVDFSSVKTISGAQAFQYAFNNISAYTGTGVLSVDFSGLETISATSVFSSAFKNTSLKQISFNKLSSINNQLAPSTSSAAFAGCLNIESVSFGGLKSTTFTTLKTQLQYLFDSTSGSTAANGCTVHFPSNFDPSDPNHTFDASTLDGYPTFGGSASYIHLAYDLPATE